ncbi:hypothetical protein V6N12_047580 [Hibiscus sabdariffa]|uniref:Uncharacterized protein n=1 Tax=Hibiscus sabdariffa TaxID=183260 RepID=A0ABR2AFA3_9ROSI
MFLKEDHNQESMEMNQDENVAKKTLTPDGSKGKNRSMRKRSSVATKDTANAAVQKKVKANTLAMQLYCYVVFGP